jgi:hypothetical protein
MKYKEKGDTEMTITERFIRNATQDNLEAIIDILGHRAYKMYSSAKDKEGVWFNEKFLSIRKRFCFAYDLLYNNSKYEWFDSDSAYDAFNCYIY